MSYMTTKLRYVVEQALDDKLLEHTEANWPQIYTQLGLADYPVWSGGKVVTGPCEERTRINNKLIRHYYMREIGDDCPFHVVSARFDAQHHAVLQRPVQERRAYYGPAQGI